MDVAAFHAGMDTRSHRVWLILASGSRAHPAFKTRQMLDYDYGRAEKGGAADD